MVLMTASLALSAEPEAQPCLMAAPGATAGRPKNLVGLALAIRVAWRIADLQVLAMADAGRLAIEPEPTDLGTERYDPLKTLFQCAGGHPGPDLALENNVDDQHRDHRNREPGEQRTPVALVALPYGQ